MQNDWSTAQATDYINTYHEQGFSEDVALRVYTTRLLGREPKLVIHGGGNTSVKTTVSDTLGKPIDVLCVKGSGWDMAHIEPDGLPAVRLTPLQQLFDLNSLGDEEMVAVQRANLLDPSSPNPSVETLLHAFIPHKFIDHTHSNAILALSNQPNGEQICREIYGSDVAYVPYVMPGFSLAKKARKCFDIAKADQTNLKGMVLLKHGLFSFGNDAKESYDRMIELVTRAEEKIEILRKKTITQATISNKTIPWVDLAPVVRGLLAEKNNSQSSGNKLPIFEFRSSTRILNYINGVNLETYSQKGTITPDHVIRIKQRPLILSRPVANKLNEWRTDSSRRLKDYIKIYNAYFKKNNRKFGNSKKQIDPFPRLLLIPGIGLCGIGRNTQDARIAADLGSINIDVVSDAEEIGSFESIPESDVFDIEYWSLEQAKIGKTSEKPLSSQIVAVTGGGSGIGSAICEAFAIEGAEVAVLDINLDKAKSTAETVNGVAIECDVTSQQSIESGFRDLLQTFGGLDIAVSNAGAAWQGRIGEVKPSILRESFELNFWGHQKFSQAAVKTMLAQKNGGCLLFNVSKQAVNPGRDFGPYGLPKAATLALMKQYALDYGNEGIRANAINADRIRSGLVSDKMITARAKARGLDKKEYMSANLLRREVRALDVAEAFVYLAKAKLTTAATLTVDGGKIEASLR